MNTRMPKETIGEYVARLRTEKGYSQRRFALLSGLSNTTISRIEKGETVSPDLETIKLLAKSLNVDELNFFTDSLPDTRADFISNPQKEKYFFSHSQLASTEDYIGTSQLNIAKDADMGAKLEKQAGEIINELEYSDDMQIRQERQKRIIKDTSLKGMRLITLRLERNITQKELGDAIGVDKTTIAQYEGEILKPDMNMIYKIADFFDVSINYLTGKEDDDLFEADEIAGEQPKNDILSTHEKQQESSMIINTITISTEYLELAKELQDNNIDPDDIRRFVEIICKNRYA
ncbi:MAG: helix-turn-helix domain-containing protein [Bacillota bacterium]